MQSTTAFAIFTALLTACFFWLLWSAHREASELRRDLADARVAARFDRTQTQNALNWAETRCHEAGLDKPASVCDAIDQLYLAYQHNKPILDGYKRDLTRVQSQIEVLASERDILHRRCEESAALREELERTTKQLERMHADLTEANRQAVHFESNERDISALLPEPPGAEIVSLVERVKQLVSERDRLKQERNDAVRLRDEARHNLAERTAQCIHLTTERDDLAREAASRTGQRDTLYAANRLVVEERDKLAKDNIELVKDADRLQAELRTRTTERDAFQKSNLALVQTFDTIVASLRLPLAQQSADGIRNALGGLLIARDHLDSIGKLLTEADYHLELTTFGKVERLLAEYKETTHRLAVVTSARDANHNTLIELETLFSGARYHPELTFAGRLKQLLSERQAIHEAFGDFHPGNALATRARFTVASLQAAEANEQSYRMQLAEIRKMVDALNNQNTVDAVKTRLASLQSTLEAEKREAGEAQRLRCELNTLSLTLRRGILNRNRATKPRQFPLVLVRKNFGLSWADSAAVCRFLNLEPRKLL